MYEIITKEQIPEYEAFVQSHPKGNFAQSWLWSKQKPMWDWDAVAVRGEDGEEIIPPCGNCRQILCDYAPDCEVIIIAEGEPAKIRARELLPFAYEVEDF